MKSEEFEKFLKENSLDIHSLSAPINIDDLSKWLDSQTVNHPEIKQHKKTKLREQEMNHNNLGVLGKTENEFERKNKNHNYKNNIKHGIHNKANVNAVTDEIDAETDPKYKKLYLKPASHNFSE